MMLTTAAAGAAADSFVATVATCAACDCLLRVLVTCSYVWVDMCCRVVGDRGGG